MILVSNSKKFFFNINSAILTKSVDGIFLFTLSSNFSYKVWRPTSWGILGYRPTTSEVTNMALIGILPRLLNFSKKLPVRFPCLHNRLKVIIQKFRKFFRWVTQFEITERPGASFNLLWILGERCILPKQLALFLKLYEKFLSSFSLVDLLLYNRWKNLLLFYVSCDSNLSLYFLTST